MASSKTLLWTDLREVNREKVTHPSRAINSNRIPNPPTIFHLRLRRTRKVSSTQDATRTNRLGDRCGRGRVRLLRALPVQIDDETRARTAGGAAGDGAPYLRH